jgi:hypothetical protein
MKDIEKTFQEYTKNISIAINYIANVIEEHGYIKDALQKEGVKVFVIGTEVVDSNFNKNKKNDLKKTLFLTLDLMDIGKVNGVVSEMNFSVFKEGVAKFVLFLDGINGEQTPMSQLMQNLINMQTEIDRKNAKELIASSLNNYKKVEISNVSNVNSKQKEDSGKTENNVVLEKDKLGLSPQIVHGYTKGNFNNIQSVNVKNSDEEILTSGENEDGMTPASRKEKIVNLLKDKGGQNVKDIKNIIGQVTDKTILRDITDLMIEKRVFRIGDKRWAKYYLK